MRHRPTRELERIEDSSHSIEHLGCVVKAILLPKTSAFCWRITQFDFHDPQFALRRSSCVPRAVHHLHQTPHPLLCGCKHSLGNLRLHTHAHRDRPARWLQHRRKPRCLSLRRRQAERNNSTAAGRAGGAQCTPRVRRAAAHLEVARAQGCLGYHGIGMTPTSPSVARCNRAGPPAYCRPHRLTHTTPFPVSPLLHVQAKALAERRQRRKNEAKSAEEPAPALDAGVSDDGADGGVLLKLA